MEPCVEQLPGARHAPVFEVALVLRLLVRDKDDGSHPIEDISKRVKETLTSVSTECAAVCRSRRNVTSRCRACGLGDVTALDLGAFPLRRRQTVGQAQSLGLEFS